MAIADRVFWLHALTPLHVGAGKGEGYIDLPLMREKLTDFPFVPGSTVKGVFADSWGAVADVRDPEKAVYDKVKHVAFGRAGDDIANAGALVFTDARLVCLPVRSLFGTFAWCTSPMVLHRLSRDLNAAGLTGWPAVPATEDGALVPGDVQPASLLVDSAGRLYLEDLDLTSKSSAEAGMWATKLAECLFPDPVAAGQTDWQILFHDRFTIVPDEIFSFLAETGTEVQPHVRIDPDYKRVEKGALWYEESLPAESILCGLVWCDPPKAYPGLRSQVEALLTDRCVQMGGKATTGKGRVQLRFAPTLPGPGVTP